MNVPEDSPIEDYGPTASIATLKRRADLLAKVRRFLADRGYWEVETPLLSADVTVDLHLDPFALPIDARSAPGATVDRLYLQTSPEFAMKRLIACGSGSIFQIAKAFRQGELGPLHNPEFTMVEWYRVGGDYHELMTEVGELVSAIAGTQTPGRRTYRQAFLDECGVDPFAGDDALLREECNRRGFIADLAERDELLNFLLAAAVEPRLGRGRPEFLYDFPASQAALSRVEPGPPPVAQRFELYVDGIEFCNGYQELTDADVLRRRNREQNRLRTASGKPPLPVESRLLAAMDAGLPECAGVALGFDRLAMLSLSAATVEEVIAFPMSRA